MARTNDVQTPFGTGVQTALAQAAGGSGGVTTIAANPSITYTGTIYGALATVWTAAVVNAAGYASPRLMASLDNFSGNGTSRGLG